MSNETSSDEEVYSYTSSKTFYKRLRSRPPSPVPTDTEYKVYASTDEDEQKASEYWPVTKWAVDYNNKNYIRSMCNKNKGFHRKLKGRPYKYKIEYDNNYFTRKMVNFPKGLYRKIPEIKRKYVPDKDDLADATGWEFDYGKEFDQVEQDVNFIPEGRIIRRGGYRWYGTKKNDADCDVKIEEERENLLNEELKEQLKYGQEFLQADIPYLEDQKSRRYTKGGYRFYGVQRNIHDIEAEELAEATRDPEWRRKYHSNGLEYLDLDMCECDRDDMSEHQHHVKKGKPFRRTILNKVYKLKKEDSSGDVKMFATRLSLIPGESRQSVYEGVPDRIRHAAKKSSSIRNIYKKKTEKFRSAKDGEYEEYEKEDTKKSYAEQRSGHEGRLHRTAETRHKLSDEDLIRKTKGSRRFDEYSYKVKPQAETRRKLSDEDLIIKRNGRRRFDESPYKAKPQAVEKRGKFEKLYDHEEYRSQKPKSSSRDRPHGNEIYRQTEMNKVKNEIRDRDHIDDHLQHIRDRGKAVKDEDKFERELTQMSKFNNKIRDTDIGSPLQHIKDRGKIIKEDNFEAELIQIPKVKNNIGYRNHIGSYQPNDKGRGKIIRGKDIYGLRTEDHKDDFEVELTQDKTNALKKMPPHVEERVRNIREKMERKMELADQKHKKQRDNGAFDHSSSDDSIDLMKHSKHPKDRGEEHNSVYEKYVSKNGSELWLKKNEKYAELHHKNHR